jgi:hypothetical protein
MKNFLPGAEQQYRYTRRMKVDEFYKLKFLEKENLSE